MKMIKLLSAVIVTLVLWNVTLTNRTVDDSLLVGNLEQEIVELKNSNTILAAQVASLGSLQYLQPKIVSAGYIEQPRVASLMPPSALAQR